MKQKETKINEDKCMPHRNSQMQKCRSIKLSSPSQVKTSKSTRLPDAFKAINAKGCRRQKRERKFHLRKENTCGNRHQGRHFLPLSTPAIK